MTPVHHDLMRIKPPHDDETMIVVMEIPGKSRQSTISEALGKSYGLC